MIPAYQILPVDPEAGLTKAMMRDSVRKGAPNMT